MQDFVNENFNQDLDHCTLLDITYVVNHLFFDVLKSGLSASHIACNRELQEMLFLTLGFKFQSNQSKT
jgi:hypothetical protein